MGVRLFNQTRHADAVLRRALVYAARRIGVKGEVVVLVKPSRRAVQGMMHQGFPFLGYLKRWSPAKRERCRSDRRLIGRLAGWYEIWLPEPSHAPDGARAYAEQFVEIAMHESAHVRDFRTAGTQHLFVRLRHPNGRHTYDRHVEVSANNQVDDAMPTDRRGKARHEAVIMAVASSSFTSPETGAAASPAASRPTDASAASVPPPGS